MRGKIKNHNDLVNKIGILTDVPFDEITDYEYSSILEQEYSHLSSKASQKIWNLFFEIIKGDYFIEQAKKIRIECNMPPQGYNSELPNSINKMFGEGNTDRHKIVGVVKDLCERYNFDFGIWGDMFEDAIYFGKPKHFLINPLDTSLVQIVELNNSNSIKRIEKLKRVFPVAILIQPNASINDVGDYINKRLKNILDKYKNNSKSKIGKVRNRKKEEFYDLVYDLWQQNKNMDTNQFIDLVKKQLNLKSFEYKTLNDILKVVRRRRKEV